MYSDESGRRIGLIPQRSADKNMAITLVAISGCFAKKINLDFCSGLEIAATDIAISLELQKVFFR